MEIDAIKEILQTVKDAGWMGVSIFAIWIMQRLLYVSILGFSVYKVVCKVVDLIHAKSTKLELRLASALGTITPLKEEEIKEIVNRIKK